MEKRSIENEIKKSYLEYAMSVIVSRAIPDIKDGLKPVQRRILYAMNELGFTHDKPYKKCARIIGETMGKYHPHGDSSIYEALARMAQDFSLRYPLIDGQGNFGSIDGDSPAAMRYTEARMARISEEITEDLDKETVEFRQNFDGSLMEPVNLPGKIPNLLINGASGIAVGMATNMVPHNLVEVARAIKHKVDNPDSTVSELLKFIKGPDFPGGGIAYYTSELADAYSTGRGKVICQGEVDLNEEKRIIIKSLPYGVNKSLFVQNIADQVKNEIIKGITDIRDESDRKGMRIVVKVRDNDMRNLVLNQLYEHSELETSIGIINLVLVENEPKILNLAGMIQYYIENRLDVIVKRSNFDLTKQKDRAHILEGLAKALDKIDMVIDMIRKSKEPAEAREKLCKSLELTEKQANAILDLRLQRLTSMEVDKVISDLKDVMARIKELETIIADESVRRSIIKKELDEVEKKYGDKRRTKIIYKELKGRSIEDLIPEEDSVIILSENSLLKRVSLEEYKAQKRGGKGIITPSRKEDSIKSILNCSSHDEIYFFTNTGRVIKTKAYEIEKKSRKSVGTAAEALLPLNEGEKIKQMVKGTDNSNSILAIVTRQGYVKRTPGKQLLSMRSNGLKIINLEEDDEVLSVEHLDGDSNIVVVSNSGKVALFNTREVRVTGRGSRGVRAMRLKENETIISSFAIKENEMILSISELGLGKRTDTTSFPVHHRGTGGVLIFKKTDRTGNIIKALPVAEGDDIIIITKNEKTIRLKVKDIKVLSRVTSGVKLIGLDDDDRVAVVSRVMEGENLEGEEQAN
ncbi:DNA gyrase subunit A [Oxyplasma meridianum]|uniref:DNA topoisomerase (ATP-hydrolyzing) n=1 Tax=Oxyplasma meridianum TaxID=3073602 RepID=A0AAX4NFV8_9ARCH